MPDADLADQRRAHRRFDLVEHGELVELEHGRDHGRIELSTRDRRHGEGTLGLGVEPSDSGAQDRPHGARHLDVSEVGLGMPSAFGIGGEHVGLDEVTHELDCEQRVAVGLVEKVRRDVLPLLAE